MRHPIPSLNRAGELRHEPPARRRVRNDAGGAIIEPIAGQLSRMPRSPCRVAAQLLPTNSSARIVLPHSALEQIRCSHRRHKDTHHGHAQEDARHSVRIAVCAKLRQDGWLFELLTPRSGSGAQRFRFDAFMILLAGSGVLQFVSPWSTSTLPMRPAASIAFLRSAGVWTPIEISATFIA